MTDAATARRAFVTGQVASLEPLDFVVVGVPEPPFDAVQIRREEDGTFAVALPPRDPSAPHTPEQVAKLAEIGFPPPAPLADVDAAVALADLVLSEVFAVADTTPVDVRHGSDRAVRDAERKVAEMRARIEPVLTSIVGGSGGGAPPQDGDGDYVLDLGHVRVFVAPRALPNSPAIIRVFAITNAGLNLTPELGLFLARLNFSLMFGRFSLDVDHQSIWFDETLLGDHVTDEELRFTVEMVAGTANEWDQKIAATFGGRIRDPEQPSSAEVAASPAKPGQGGYL
ncbi:MAG: hypothetical protein QOF60_2746 [Actinomycetota bacterium]|jgi:hypothetical protein|nr:hypothetical protein [Actinomycetota bacterium]